MCRIPKIDFQVQVEVLLQEGAPVDSVAPSGNTAVFYAASSGRSKILELLVTKGADVKLRNIAEDSSLMFCASGANQQHDEGSDPSNFVKCFSYLLDQGVSIGETNKNGLNALHCASNSFSLINAVFVWFNAHPELHAVLKAAINQKTIIGDTPLHFAAVDGAFKCCELLLSNGADPLVRNKAGKTPLANAKEPTCISLLKTAESTASESFHKLQQDLLDVLASESTTKASVPPTNNKSKSSKKASKASVTSEPSNHAQKTKTESLVQHKADSAQPSSSKQPSTQTTKQTQEMTVQDHTPALPQSAASWASIVTSASPATSSNSKPKFVYERTEKSSQTAEQVAAEASKTISASTPEVAIPAAIEPSSYSNEQLEERMVEINHTAKALGLKISHMLSLDMSELSMEQLDALEAIHHRMLKSITDAKLEVVRKQERAYFEEELDRRMDTLKRIQSAQK